VGEDVLIHIVRRHLGRPGAESKQIARARHELAKGLGIGKVARITRLGTGTVHKLKRETTSQIEPYDASPLDPR